jgi:D-glycero-D-manno-heptose 1,7-bisphosphate phosphatase
MGAKVHPRIVSGPTLQMAEATVSAQNWPHALPGVPEALRRLNEAGLRVVVSNQRGIAKRLYTAADLQAMHAQFQRLLKRDGARIDAFFIRPHETDECNCRKPLPGLFEQAVARFPEIAAATCVMIGDSPSDVEFGRRLGNDGDFCSTGDLGQGTP